MKIRDGHVSNSSSSSFIVAFPRKPKSAKDVLDFMFDGKEGGVGLEYHDEGLSYRQVAERVWNDIKMGNVQNGTMRGIVETLRGRYHYSPNINGRTNYYNGCVDDDGGSWAYKRDRYFLSDDELTAAYKKHAIEEEREDLRLRDKEAEIIGKFKAPKPKWAYKGGKDNRTNKPYTKEEVAAYEKYVKAMEEFRKTDPEYVAYDKERMKFHNERWEESAKLSEKLAQADGKNFVEDNKKKFIFIVSYADDGGEAIMEHGRIFRNVPHIVVSNH